MNITLLIIGLLFMGLSVYQLNRKTKMDTMIIQNYERKYKVTDPVKFLKIEHTSKALFGAFVALMGLLEIYFLDVNTAAIIIVAGILIWQFADVYFKRDFLIKK